MVCWEMGWFLRFGESNDRSLAKVQAVIVKQSYAS